MGSCFLNMLFIFKKKSYKLGWEDTPGTSNGTLFCNFIKKMLCLALYIVNNIENYVAKGFL